MKILVLTLLASLLAGTEPKFDKTVHDFGTISLKDGPQTCNFTYTNDGDETAYILAVVSSCGCTEVEWTRSAIEPGQNGTIKATYENNDGPYPFDKTLTVYLSTQKKPIILHIKGIVKAKKSK